MTTLVRADLRSDTVTKPTTDMRQIMFDAEVGDDVYEEDPTVKKLETQVAKILKKESALFVPSGTMANQIAIHLHCRPGDSIVTERNSHCFEYESGAAAAMSGVQFDFFDLDRGNLSSSVRSAIREPQVYNSTTSLLVLENTHNRGGGRVLNLSDIQAAVKVARQHQLASHCDGARLWNAAVALDVDIGALSEPFDTVAVCLSKGLGCPVGSLLAGSDEHMARARKIRKRWGGGMRQAGYLAAAGLFAIEKNRQRLADDHHNARKLRDGIAMMSWSGDRCDIIAPNPMTNMVYFRFPRSAGENIHSKLLEQGILLSSLSEGWFRAVTHLHIGATEIEYIIDKIHTVTGSH